MVICWVVLALNSRNSINISQQQKQQQQQQQQQMHMKISWTRTTLDLYPKFFFILCMEKGTLLLHQGPTVLNKMCFYDGSICRTKHFHSFSSSINVAPLWKHFENIQIFSTLHAIDRLVFQDFFKNCSHNRQLTRRLRGCLSIKVLVSVNYKVHMHKKS